MSLLMIHKAYMPVYKWSRFFLRDGRDGTNEPTEGSTRGPRGPKNNRHKLEYSRQIIALVRQLTVQPSATSSKQSIFLMEFLFWELTQLCNCYRIKKWGWNLLKDRGLWAGFRILQHPQPSPVCLHLQKLQYTFFPSQNLFLIFSCPSCSVAYLGNSLAY